MKKFLLVLLIGSLYSCVSSNGLPIKKVNATTFEASVENRVDHTAWDALLKQHVKANGLVNYKGFIADKAALYDYIDFLAAQKPRSTWTTQELLAFYINLYNASTIKLIVDHYPVESIKDVDATISPFLKKFITVDGKTLSLADVEKGILQKMDEPRIHFAINCASISCPKLMRTAYTAQNVNALMDQAAREFVNSEKNEIQKSKVRLSEIFKWYKSDFITASPTILDYVNRYSEVKISQNAEIDYIEYNWNLNDTN